MTKSAEHASLQNNLGLFLGIFSTSKQIPSYIDVGINSYRFK